MIYDVLNLTTGKRMGRRMNEKLLYAEPLEPCYNPPKLNFRFSGPRMRTLEGAETNFSLLTRLFLNCLPQVLRAFS